MGGEAGPQGRQRVFARRHRRRERRGIVCADQAIVDKIAPRDTLCDGAKAIAESEPWALLSRARAASSSADRLVRALLRRRFRRLSDRLLLRVDARGAVLAE